MADTPRYLIDPLIDRVMRCARGEAVLEMDYNGTKIEFLGADLQQSYEHDPRQFRVTMTLMYGRPKPVPDQPLLVPDWVFTRFTKEELEAATPRGYYLARYDRPVGVEITEDTLRACAEAAQREYVREHSGH